MVDPLFFIIKNPPLSLLSFYIMALAVQTPMLIVEIPISRLLSHLEMPHLLQFAVRKIKLPITFPKTMLLPALCFQSSIWIMLPMVLFFPKSHINEKTEKADVKKMYHFNLGHLLKKLLTFCTIIAIIHSCKSAYYPKAIFPEDSIEGNNFQSVLKILPDSEDYPSGGIFSDAMAIIYPKNGIKNAFVDEPYAQSGINAQITAIAKIT